MKSRGKVKLGKLPAHFSSVSHKAALESYCCFLQRNNYIDIKLDAEIRNMRLKEEGEQNFNRKIIEILLDVTCTMTRQGLAFRGNNEKDIEQSGNFYEIVSLISRHNPLLKKWMEDRALKPYKIAYLSPNSQNEMISIVANQVRAKIIEDIQGCDFFTIMADTTPDLSHKDILSVVIRICDEEGSIYERLLEVRECVDKTGIGIAKDIIDVLVSNDIDTKSLAFQSFDFASSMSGEFKGAQKKVSELVGHNVPYIPCQNHRVNTALEHCIKASNLVSAYLTRCKNCMCFSHRVRNDLKIWMKNFQAQRI
ncbi:hypothetical protein JTE90_018207 [Oedothorax gibbosus]|uniref:DUF4371 domain-containing protein n=1 Tax=Oedothorax gibbosus TaxID=931172 RepID=A0AAV6U940_9ARAC|nr:hypothetical protein JTE90_018207 [Oedothorax gibbosus]